MKKTPPSMATALGPSNGTRTPPRNMQRVYPKHCTTYKKMLSVILAVLGRENSRMYDMAYGTKLPKLVDSPSAMLITKHETIANTSCSL